MEIIKGKNSNGNREFDEDNRMRLMELTKNKENEIVLLMKMGKPKVVTMWPRVRSSYHRR